MGETRRALGAMDWIEAALSLVYPDVCGICGEGEAGRDEGYVCAECAGGPGHVRWVGGTYCERCGLPYEGVVTGTFECGNCGEMELHFEAARAAVVATPFLLDVVHRYKYRGAVWFEPFLAGLLLREALPRVRREDWDAIVPVPLHPLRLREREFNQAERLGARLARATGIPLRTRWVERTRATRTQALLDRRERVQNVGGSFAVRAGAGPIGGRVLVVDDVLTTGATTSGVARALRRAGAERVGVWTVARGVMEP
ncbi:MAG: ComF family protein [Verrucomicrobiae bacterium]|nr:ComF family protein [Verrucomicrobiae bacterium]